VEYTPITPLSDTTAYMKGIRDLRGENSIIFDRKHRLNISEHSLALADSSRIVIPDDMVTKKKIGILVDDVTSVATFESNQVDYTPKSLIKEDSSIIGIIKRAVLVNEKEKNELIIWLDIKHLIQGIKITSCVFFIMSTCL